MQTIYNKSYTNYIQVTSRFMNNMLHERILNILHLSPSDTLLEIGCNQGAFLTKAGATCKRTAGIDLNCEAIENCSHCEAYCMDATNLRFEEEEFSKIVSMHTIEHIPDLPKAFSEMHRVLKSGGKAILAYPYEPIRGIWALPTAVFVHKDLSMARKMHIHKLNPKKLKELIRGTGLILKKSELVLTPMPTFISVLEKK
ncbi:class I SAM-dependent methyltransferase [Candidatus Woesearchaeota archaeon]|nr:class I SAM-dependent methyltransferase [Candidatus Woesearchaeota archaeon]